MKPLRWFLPLLVASILALPLATAATDTDSPVEVTHSLYSHSLKHFAGFTPEGVKADKPWLTPELYTRLFKKVNVPTAKGDAPDIDGDVFLNCQEPPTKFQMGHSTIDGTNAKVEVILVSPGGNLHYIVLLEQIDGKWKVSDVDYGKDGKLTDLLK